MKLLSGRSSARLISISVLFLVLSGCDSKAQPSGAVKAEPDSSLEPSGSDAGMAEADAAVAPEPCSGTLESLREVVFAETCALAGCHTGARPSENLALSTADVMTRLVGIPSLECEDWLLIDPGKPDESLLVAKLEGKVPKGCGSAMPLGRPRLPNEHIECVREWIESLEPISGPLCTYCDLECVDLENDDAHCGTCDTACDADRSCEAGSCICTAPLIDCNGACVDASSDEAHCGRCDLACPPTATCTSGECDCAGDDTAICDGACTDIASNAARCGDCDTSCPALATCKAGQCECAEGLTRCGDECVDLDSDPDHCGKCETTCGESTVCFEGDCAADCGNLTECSGACVDTATSLLHCGGCDNSCATGAACNGVSCECPVDESVCEGACTNTFTDEGHCGTCEIACVGEEQCATGSCACPNASDTSCSGKCVDTTVSEEYCGSCETACSGEEQCSVDGCGCADSAETSCGGSCVNLATDTSNCGECGEACAPGEVCGELGCTCSPDLVSFATDVAPLLDGTCTGSMCHNNIDMKKGLNLSTGSAFASLVDVDSNECDDSRKRVDPGSVTNSYLIDKLLGVRLCGARSERMPDGGEPLSASEIDRVARWICQGALDN